MIDYTNFKNKEEIIQFINSSPLGYSKTIKAHNKLLYDEVMKIGKPKGFAENLYVYLYGDSGCTRCGCETAFQNIKQGYRQFCKPCYEFIRSKKEMIGPPQKCINQSCNNAAYGINSHTGRYNVHCSLKCRGIHNSLVSRDKAKKTSMEKYGVEHYSATEECKKKVKETMFERYGTNDIFSIPEFREKIIKTNLEKYNVTCIFKREDYKQRIEKTMIELYGVKNASQNIEIHRKKLRSNKSYTLKNGETIDIQGYEHHFLDQIQRIMSIDSSIIDVPSINYLNNGETKVYFPDFYLREYNLIVEIKSEYTINCDKEMIYNKAIGTICAGYNKAIIVYDEKGNMKCSMFYNEMIMDIMNNIGYDSIFEKCGDTFCQYVKNGVSINFSHGILINDLFMPITTRRDWLNDIKSVYKESYCFTHDVLDTGAIVNFILKCLKIPNEVKKINARECTVSQIDYATSEQFLQEHHIQGGGITGGINYGLCYNDQLVALMCFSKPRLGVGKKRENTYELTRFCSSGRVVGGASKLISAFKKDHQNMDIISYSDNSYSNGDLYSVLGFELKSEVRPRYKYIKVGENDMEPRFKYAKHKLKKMQYYDEKLSEHEIMTLEGYVRVYDCGKKTWILKSS